MHELSIALSIVEMAEEEASRRGARVEIAAAVEFDMLAARKSIESVRPGMRVLEVSAKTGGGMQECLRFLESHSDRDISARGAGCD